MRVLIQRVSRASVTVEGRVVSAIGPGLLLLFGVEVGDGGAGVAGDAGGVSGSVGAGGAGGAEGSGGAGGPSGASGSGGSAQRDLEWLAAKVLNLRIFPDEAGAMNRSVLETGGDLIVVSQFTLHASTKKGNRPSFIRAARPEQAIPLYEQFVATLQAGLGKPVGTGVFGAHMDVELVNDGPVTLWIDTAQRE